MKFAITDCNNNTCICIIASNNGKNALKRFRNGLLTTGLYEIHKIKGVWVLMSTYGAYFVARPVKGE